MMCLWRLKIQLGCFIAGPLIVAAGEKILLPKKLVETVGDKITSPEKYSHGS